MFHKRSLPAVPICIACAVLMPACNAVLLWSVTVCGDIYLAPRFVRRFCEWHLSTSLTADAMLCAFTLWAVAKWWHAFGWLGHRAKMLFIAVIIISLFASAAEQTINIQLTELFAPWIFLFSIENCPSFGPLHLIAILLVGQSLNCHFFDVFYLSLLPYLCTPFLSLYSSYCSFVLFSRFKFSFEVFRKLQASAT